MKYLWIGLQFEYSIQQLLMQCNAKILSGKISEDSIIEGLQKNNITSMDSINSYRIPSVLNSKILFCRRKQWQHQGDHVSVGYLNIPYIDQISRTLHLTYEARKWATKHKNDPVTVFVYSMHSPFLAAAQAIRRIIKNAKIVLFVLDLPQYMDFNMSPVKKVLKALDWNQLKKQMAYVDKYILYSRHMAEFLALPEGSWTVMEGSFDPSSLVSENIPKTSDKISVMYSGIVDLRYGIPELLNALKLLDNRFELWITGGGNAEDLIKEHAKKDFRIKYYGFLPSRKELLLKQKQATMLISTRRPDEPASAYCFPSKLFEYMISGNPVLSCRIGGIPDEYFDYLVEMKSTSPADIAEAIQRVAEMPAEARDQLGERGKQYVLEEKNNVVQAKKILNFVNEGKN